MSDAAESVQDNAASGTNAEGANGTGSNGKQPGDQDMVPRARLDAVLERDRQRDVELAELRGLVEGMKGQGSNGGGQKTYTRAELRAMVEDEKITESEADQIIADQQEGKLREIVSNTVSEAINSERTKTKAEAEIDRYAAALPDVMTGGTATRDKFEQEVTWLIQQGDKREDPRTILRAMRAAFGPVEQLNIDTSKGRRETVQDTTTAGDGDGGKEPDGKTPRYPNWMSSRQKDYYDKQIASGYYKDRGDCLKRIEGSFDVLKSAAARDKAQAA